MCAANEKYSVLATFIPTQFRNPVEKGQTLALGSNLPLVRNRSGLKFSGSGKFFGSCMIAVSDVTTIVSLKRGICVSNMTRSS